MEQIATEGILAFLNLVCIGRKNADDRFIAIFQNGAQSRYLYILMNNISNELLIITYIVQIYCNSGVTHFLPHNELFIEKTTLKYQHTLVDFQVSF